MVNNTARNIVFKNQDVVLDQTASRRHSRPTTDTRNSLSYHASPSPLLKGCFLSIQKLCIIIRVPTACHMLASTRPFMKVVPYSSQKYIKLLPSIKSSQLPSEHHAEERRSIYNTPLTASRPPTVRGILGPRLPPALDKPFRSLALRLSSTDSVPQSLFQFSLTKPHITPITRSQINPLSALTHT